MSEIQPKQEVVEGPSEDQASGSPGFMFASAWVKVEVVEEDNVPEFEYVNTDITPTEYPEKDKREPKKRKTLSCPKCDFTTIYTNSLNLHKKKHEDVKPNICDICQFSTRYLTCLQRHIKTQHGDEARIFKCDECDYTSKFKSNLKAHRRKHMAVKQFQCEHCTFATAYRHNYIKHSKTHNIDPENGGSVKDRHKIYYKCDKCPFVTKFEGHITRHLAKIHKEVAETAFKCDLCDFATKLNWRLTLHKNRSLKEQPIKCDNCTFETLYMCEMKQHQNTHIRDVYTKKDIIMPLERKIPIVNKNGTIAIGEFVPNPEIIENGTVFTNTDELIIDKHAEANNYVLNGSCADWSKVDVKETHDKIKPFQCELCSYSARFKASVQRHFQRHHTDKNRPYLCTNCDFSTKTKDQIALHCKRSQSVTPIKCSVCLFSTNFKCTMVMHQKSHHQFRCNSCSYTCKLQSDLQRHYNTTHMGFGLKCRFCDFQAARKESLLCHETVHTGDKPYKCDFCTYSSVRKRLLDKHVRRYHFDRLEATVISSSKIESLKVVPIEGSNVLHDVNTSDCI